MTKYGIRIGDVMRTKIVKVNPKTPCNIALKKMIKAKEDYVLVVENDRLFGLVTVGDFVVRLFAKNKDPKTTISKIMTRKPKCLNLNDDIGKALDLLRKHKIHKLVVLDNGKPVGILKDEDLASIGRSLLDVLIEKLKILQPSFKFKLFRR